METDEGIPQHVSVKINCPKVVVCSDALDIFNKGQTHAAQKRGQSGSKKNSSWKCFKVKKSSGTDDAAEQDKTDAAQKRGQSGSKKNSSWKCFSCIKSSGTDDAAEQYKKSCIKKRQNGHHVGEGQMGNDSKKICSQGGGEKRKAQCEKKLNTEV